ncbi:LOW QUALITY PROTEIN: hypothetical protein Cgig2_016324 [Carnegiea gigantea]|uniref:Uncharacterized protein n=1 Tax=Carnegiea gigantea TaxID=171969 RepID=A0A9Q1Q5L5_9CARY|nr:LOW QUALITY PROTEIN: hypothetical protein Cgig2_016324 [Carnegiea gigantea]
MSTMMDTIMQQRAVEATSSARPLPHFEYVPTMGCEPSYRYDPVVFHRHSERMREAPHTNGDRQTRRENQDYSTGVNAQHSHRPGHGGPVRLTMASTSYATSSRRVAWSEELEQTSTPQDKEQIDRFLKRGLWFLQKEHELIRLEPRDKECSTEIVATIAGGYAEGITRSGSASRSLTSSHGRTRKLNYSAHHGIQRGTGPTITSSHNDLLLIEIKVASAIVLGGHHHLGLPEEVDLPGPGDCPFSAPHPGLRGIGGEPQWDDPSTFALWRQSLHHDHYPRQPRWHHPPCQASQPRRLKAWSPHCPDPLQQLVLTLSLGTPAILDELDIRLKIAFNTEGFRCQSHKGFLRELGALVPQSSALADLSASASTLERASSSWCCKSFFWASKASFSFFNFSERCLYLAATSSDLWRLALRGVWQIRITSSRLNLTSTMATCSSSTIDSSEESAGASDHDLASFSAKARLTGGSATRKSATEARVCTEGSPMASGRLSQGINDGAYKKRKISEHIALRKSCKGG